MEVANEVTRAAQGVASVIQSSAKLVTIASVKSESDIEAKEDAFFNLKC